MFRKLAKAARLSAYTQGRRGLKDGVAMTLEHIPALKNLKPELVVDVGANKGQFSLLARQLFPQARVIAFEPLSEPAMKFEKVLGGDQQVSLHHLPLERQRKTGKSTFPSGLIPPPFYPSENSQPSFLELKASAHKASRSRHFQISCPQKNFKLPHWSRLMCKDLSLKC